MLERPDRRTSNELRPVTISFANLARVDGSCRFGFGPTASALASVSGPIEVRLAAEQPSRATLEVHLRPLSGIAATETKALSSTISSILLASLIPTQNPRTLIQVIIQSLAAPHNPNARWKDLHVASMINATTLALLNAGSIPMKGVICAVCIGKTSDSYLVDPSDAELRTLETSGSFAFLFTDGTVNSAICVWTNWRSASTTGFDESEISRARAVAAAAAQEVWCQIRSAIGGTGQSQAAVEEDDAEMEI